jgi:hypothetical protein
MRTTLTIDDDLMPLIEELRRSQGLSLKVVVNQLLRAGIQCQTQPPKPRPYRTKPRKLKLRAGFDPTKLNQLVDESEAEFFTATERK